MQDEYKEILIMIIVVALVFSLLIGIVVFIVLFYQKKKFQHLQQMNTAQQQYKESLLQTRIEIQEQTFKNIAQEIHDNIGQVLTLVKLNLRTIDLAQADAASGKLEETVELVARVIRDLRDLSKTLNTDFINQLGLEGAIEQQLVILQKSGLYQTSLSVEGKVYKLDPQRELVLFRVIQELINNMLKHASASCITVEMKYGQQELLLVVRDDGKGFDLDILRNNDKGQGLRNIINRVELIRGNVQFSSSPGNGTVASIGIPQ